MFTEALEIFESNIKALEILCVINGVKPAARILVKEGKIGVVGDFLGKNGLHYCTSDFKLLKTDEGQYSDSGLRVSLNDKREGYYVMYIAKDSGKTDVIKRLEEGNDHYNLGIALGYPECCCRFFCDNFSKGNEDLTLGMLKNSGGFSFDFRNNIAMRHFDVSLLFHFPCSFECKESVKTAQGNLDALKADNSEYYRIFEGMLKGAVIYSNSNVILLRRASLKGNRIYYNGLMGLKQTAIYNQLKKEDFVLVNSQTSFRARNIDFSSNIGIMYFY